MNQHRSLLIASLFIAICSCNKYKPYESNYPFKSADGRPAYADLDYWAAHPWKWDPSDSIPEPLKNEWRDSSVDVFFIHPTTHTKIARKKQANAKIDDARINARTDYTTILYQASVFNADCRIFSPRYRQGHLRNFMKKDKAAAAKAFDLAYEDVRTAFLYYLENWNKGRPIIIASHSQGSVMSERLLKEFFDTTILRNKLVVAYIIGWPVGDNIFSNLKMCRDSIQTGCMCGWRTVRKDFIPRYHTKMKMTSMTTNPLNWTIDDKYASKELNKGSVLLNFNKVYPRTTDAQVKNELLNIRKPKFPGGFFYFTRNYHIGDINLFYINVREDVRRRIGLFWKR